MNIQYWVNIRGNGWLQVTLIEYQRIDRTTKLTGARLAGSPNVNSFCYTRRGKTTEGRILKDGGERYKWDTVFQDALKRAA